MATAIKLYADVEYLGTVYKDAELLGNRWHFQNVNGALNPFLYQGRVTVLTEAHDLPQHWRALSSITARLGIVLADVDLGMTVAHLAASYYRVGNVVRGETTKADAEQLHAVAVRFAAHLSPDDLPLAQRRIDALRETINDLLKIKPGQTAQPIRHLVPKEST